MCVETDIDFSESYYEAFIGKIIIDGREVRFDISSVEPNKVHGIRIPLTSSWSSAPLTDYSIIGTFSKLEVTLIITERGKLDNPFDLVDEPEVEETPPPPVDIPTDDPDHIPAPEARLPGWVIPATIGGVLLVAIVTVFIVLKTKKL